MASGKPADVLTASERVTWQEFIARLRDQLKIDVAHFGVKIFNDPTLKFETEILPNGKSEVWVSLKGGS